jgi:hypothetical protein
MLGFVGFLEILVEFSDLFYNCGKKLLDLALAPGSTGKIGILEGF